MTKFEELYNKYLQILKIEDKDEQNDALDDLDEEIYNFICKKYPELEDIEDYDFIEFMDTFTTERSFIRGIIQTFSYDDIIRCLTDININNIIEKYINKNIQNYENN